jgi:hypothetical protein
VRRGGCGKRGHHEIKHEQAAKTWRYGEIMNGENGGGKWASGDGIKM